MDLKNILIASHERICKTIIGITPIDYVNLTILQIIDDETKSFNSWSDVKDLKLWANQ